MPALYPPNGATYVVANSTDLITVTCGATDRMVVSWVSPAGVTGSRGVGEGRIRDLGPWPVQTVVTLTPTLGSPVYDIKSLNVFTAELPVNFNSSKPLFQIFLPLFSGIEVEVLFSGNGFGMGGFFGCHNRAVVRQDSLAIYTVGTDLQFDPSGAATTNYPIDVSASNFISSTVLGRVDISATFKSGGSTAFFTSCKVEMRVKGSVSQVVAL